MKYSPSEKDDLVEKFSMLISDRDVEAEQNCRPCLEFDCKIRDSQKDVFMHELIN